MIGPGGISNPAPRPKPPPPITPAPPVEHRERPYDDGLIDGGFLRYRYRGTDANHRDNVGLRTAMQRQAPLICLHGIVQGLYEPAWPVFIVEDHPESLTFIVAIDDQVDAPAVWQFTDPAALTARRQYVTAVVRQRLHQRGFRQRVLRASQQCCAICRLRHDELLQAAHTLPAGHPLGEPVIPNGLALCKLHHAAFDRYLIGVTPDSRSPCASTCWKKSTGRCFSMVSRAFKAGASTCRAPTTSSPIATSWRSATPSSAARAERLYLSGHVDTKIPRCVEWGHGVAPACGDHDPLPDACRDGPGARHLGQALPGAPGDGHRSPGTSREAEPQEADRTEAAHGTPKLIDR